MIALLPHKILVQSTITLCMTLIDQIGYNRVMATKPKAFQPDTKYSLNEIARIGREFYINELKDKLEKTKMGHYVVTEVESKEYFVDRDLKKAIDRARKKFPNKLFHIVRVGDLHSLAKNDEQKNAWLF